MLVKAASNCRLTSAVCKPSRSALARGPRSPGLSASRLLQHPHRQACRCRAPAGHSVHAAAGSDYQPPKTMGFLGFNCDLRDQLVFYGSYHNNPINQMIHFVFVPAIWWTVAVWLAYTPEAFHYSLASLLPACCAQVAQYLQFNGSFFLAAVYSLYYVVLEPFAGLTWTGLVALPLWGLANWFRLAVPTAWAWALVLHLFSWFAQIVFGHQMAEHRKPALLDSFFQSLVLAPLFVWFELLFLLGYRRQLHAEVQARVQHNIDEWKKHRQPLLASGASTQ